MKSEPRPAAQHRATAVRTSAATSDVAAADLAGLGPSPMLSLNEGAAGAPLLQRRPRRTTNRKAIG